MTKSETAASILHLSQKEFNGFKRSLSMKSKHHETILLHKSPLQLAKTMLTEGAGLAKVVRSSLQLFNPFHVASTIKAVKHNKETRGRLSVDDVERARLVKQAYKDPSERKDVAGYSYVPEDSDGNIALYKRARDGQAVMAIRGTIPTKVKDLVDDLAIIVGTEDKTNRFQGSLDKFDELKQKHPKLWVAGHSLGGTQALNIGEKRNTEVFAFNPGFNAFSDDHGNENHPKTTLLLVNGDPLSNTIMTRKLNDKTKVLPSVSINPLKNHSLDNFTAE